MVDVTKLPKSRVDDAREVARVLLDELELGQAPILNSLMKAKRLARLIRDSDAEVWLDLETKGYPKEFNVSLLGSCRKYAIRGGRVTEDGKYWLGSLPEFEGKLQIAETARKGLQFPTNIAPSASSSNPMDAPGIHVANALAKAMAGYQDTLSSISKNHAESVKLFSGLKGALHLYVTHCDHALAFSDVSESLFEKARADVDRFVRGVAPKAAERSWRPLSATTPAATRPSRTPSPPCAGSSRPWRTACTPPATRPSGIVRARKGRSARSSTRTGSSPSSSRSSRVAAPRY
jgi:hypothetical protein